MDRSTATRGPWRTGDLDSLPINSIRYEIVDGNLFMSKAKHWYHQRACGKILYALDEWSQEVGLGEAVIAPGVLFDEADDVIPDVVWISSERLDALMDKAGHLTGAPELAVEVLSFGEQQEKRDRQFKRKLYETQGVREYWIVDWRLKQVEIYRRDQGMLRLVATLLAEDTVTSPLLPGFSCPVVRFFD